mgnify:CR=1 FL=1
MAEKLRIGFIGAGRVATALARALSSAGEDVVAVASRSRAAAQACAAEVNGCVALDAPQQVVDRSDLVFLTVPDDAIAPMAASLRWREGQSVVHCSGATELSALAPARMHGARTGSFHPLLMFADPQIAARALPRSAIALEAEAPLLGILEALVANLGAQSLRVPAGARAAYHAASHYGAAFLCVLLDQGMKILHESGMSGDAPREALLSLARGTLEAMEHADPAQAMAGAYARGDTGTARRHLQVLGAMDPEIAALYRELAARSVELALAARRIDAEKANTLRALLNKPDS